MTAKKKPAPRRSAPAVKKTKLTDLTAPGKAVLITAGAIATLAGGLSGWWAIEGHWQLRRDADAYEKGAKASLAIHNAEDRKQDAEIITRLDLYRLYAEKRSRSQTREWLAKSIRDLEFRQSLGKLDPAAAMTLASDKKTLDAIDAELTEINRNIATMRAGGRAHPSKETNE